MLFVYDSFELNRITSEADMYRGHSYMYSGLADSYQQLHMEELEAINYYEETYIDESSDELGFFQFHGIAYDGDNVDIQKHVDIINELYELSSEMADRLSSFASLYAGGRMNVELTPYRYEINTMRLRIYDLLGEEDALTILEFENPNSYEYVLKEQKRLEILMDSATPDDFNEYTVTIANYPSRALEGLMLFVILVFALLLFYDLFAKDFDAQTYRTIFTEPYSRKTIIQSKVFFAVIYLFLLIIIGMLSVTIYLLFVRRIGYNVLSTRFGYMLHPTLMNINILSLIGREPTYIILPALAVNIISIMTGVALLSVWIMATLTMSYKLKSSASTLTIGVFVLLAIFFINFTPLKDAFSYIVPLFGFNYTRMITGESPLVIIYIIILSIVFQGILAKIIYKDSDNSDLLGGDSHD